MKIKINKEKFDIKVCDSRLSKFLGLMFRFPRNDGLLFIFDRKKKISLHMLFVFFPIDIVYLDTNKRVIKILKSVKPFTPYIKSVESKYIIELKDCKSVRVGDVIKLEMDGI